MRSAIVCLSIMLGASPGMAEESAIPSLGDHHFVPLSTIAEPFITTFVQTLVTLGAVNAMVPLVDSDSTVIALIGADHFLASLGVRYQHAVNTWLAAGFSLGVVGRVGTSTTTLLSEGLTADLKYDLGWLMKIYRSRSFILSGSVSLGNNSATIINIQDWAASIGGSETIPLVRSRPSLRGSGGLHAGWGLSRRFGLLGTVIMSYAESLDGLGENGWDSDVRLAFSYDAKQDIKVPVGLALTGGRYGNNVNSDSGTGVWFWSLRLATQSRSDFTVGFEFSTSYLTSSKSDMDQTLYQFGFDMRYYY
jgi:hypothetical protein